MIFDTHAHLNLDIFKEKVGEIIDDSIDEGVSLILVPAIDFRSGLRSVELANKFSIIYCALGIHPLEAEKLDEDSFLDQWNRDFSPQIKSNKKVLAIGEIGLDRVKGKNINSQIKFFEIQINLAKKLKKPIIIHNRGMSREIIAILKNIHFDQKVIFHCAEADKYILDFAMDNNHYLGVNGDLTYNPRKQEFFRNVPLDKIVLETDSPFLVPEPLRSQKIFPNQPKNINIILNFISNMLTQPREELEEIFWQNSLSAFNL
ncbi:MAG: TatD family hydrolase [Patescibacteria group bacterium]|nr:TatD family hydrolase [Patescibacteria group bacterium]